MVTINSEKLMHELDDILHYEFKKNDLDKKSTYDFSNELNMFLNKFIPFNFCDNDNYVLNNPKIYTEDGERILRFNCTDLENNNSFLFYINYYIGIKEVTIKDLKNNVSKKYQKNYLNFFLNAMSFFDNGKKIQMEIVTEKDCYIINYQNGNDQIIKIILSSKDIENIKYDFNGFITLLEYKIELDWKNILIYFKEVNKLLKNKKIKFDIKAMEMKYDEDRNYFFKYMQIKDGKFVRFEEKNNDLVTILDENGIWHYIGDNVKIDADDLNETVRFKSEINKKTLSRKITNGEQSIKRVKSTITEIV